MSANRWTKEQLKLAFNLYCQLPFGKLHSRNAEIVELAGLIGRTPSAVAMKLVNFASLDPAIITTGRTGLGNASALDREVWDEFHADWETLALESTQLNQQLRKEHPAPAEPEATDAFDLADFTGETRRVLTEQRVKQNFFRRAVLASYRGRCCMSGLSDSRLLVASHIVPWSKDKSNRLNPSNGLCLSALHDKAFDQGLLSIDDDLKILVSTALKKLRRDGLIEKSLLTLEGHAMELPERFSPDPIFIAWHRNTLFLDNRK